MLIGPYTLPEQLDQISFVSHFLTKCIADLVSGCSSSETPQHVVLAHFRRNVLLFLDSTYPRRWIVRGSHVPWPPRSADLTPLDFYLWDYHKSLDIRSICHVPHGTDR